MIKMMAAIRRKPGMTQAEYFPYIRDAHGGLARCNPLTLRRYIQNHVFDGAFGASTDPGYQIPFHRDSVTELWFDSFDSLGETLAHPYTREKVGPDAVNFSDLETALAILTRELEVAVPRPGSGGTLKVLYFLRKRAYLDLDEYFHRWAWAHEATMKDHPHIASAIRRCVQSLQIPEGNPMLAYFGGKNMPIYEGVTSLWYEEEGALPAFRAYQAALEERDRQRSFFDPGQSFFLMAREVVIIGAQSLGLDGLLP